MRTIQEPKARHIDGPLYWIRCRNNDCAAVLEMDRSELTKWDDWNGTAFLQFGCPHCRVETAVFADRLSYFQVPDAAEKSALIDKAEKLTEDMKGLMKGTSLWQDYPMLATVRFVHRGIKKANALIKRAK